MLSLQQVLKSSRAAIDLASIMVGIIVIGLIGGVIAATVFAVIPWSQDRAARQQLDSIASAESAYRGLSSDNPSTLKNSSASPTSQTDPNQVVVNNTFTGSSGLDTNNLLAANPGLYCVTATSDGSNYDAYVKSGSGKVFTQSAKAGSSQVTDTRASCLGDITNGALPGTAGNAGSGSDSNTGSGSTGGSATPADPTTFTASTLGQGGMRYASSFAIRADGIYGWGRNDYGQVSYTDTEKVGTTRVVTSPRLVVPGSFVQVVSNNSFGAAVTDTGDVYTWGKIDAYGSSATTKLAGVSNIAKIALGEKHMLLLSKTGTVYAYGNNDSGQVGNRSTTFATAPVQVLAGGTNPIVDIAATQRASAALRQDGEVDTWGNNTINELGNGTTGSYMTYPTQNKMPVKTGISLQAGNSTFGVVTSDGKVYIWGDNSAGNYGDGTTTQASGTAAIPRTIPAFSGKTMKKLYVGPYASYAIDDSGTVYAWGLNRSKLGNGSTAAQYTPTALSIPNETIKDISTGWTTTFFLTDNGKIYGTGDNSSYSLGLGPNDTATRNSPVLINLIPAT